jgi:hypothetical protein
MFNPLPRHFVGPEAFGQMTDSLVKPLPKLTTRDLKRCLDGGGDLTLDSLFLLVAQCDAEVACIGQRHYFGFERELGTEFFGSRIILRTEQTAQPYSGLLHKLSELLGQGIDGWCELVR